MDDIKGSFSDFIKDDPLFKAYESVSGSNSIHSENAIQFYEHTLEADKFTLSICKYGLLFPFVSEPPYYEEPNNKSAMDENDLVEDTLKSWEEQGFIRRVAGKPKCINPLSVASKFDIEKQVVKKRICLDLSRHVNYYMVDSPVKLSD